MPRPRRKPHPGSACCEATPAEFQDWVARQRVAFAQARELIRNLRAAADVAHAEDLRLTVADQGGGWNGLAAQLGAHRVRLCGLANGYAQSLQVHYGQMDRVLAAHPWQMPD